MTVKMERLELAGLDRARYFVPTAICIYLAVLCLVLVVTSAFLVSLENAVAVTGAGLFGLLMTGSLGWIFWRAQRRELLFTRVITAADASSNFAVVRSAAMSAGWRLLREEPARRLDAQTSTSLLEVGERVVVRFVDNAVLVASICDPSVGFSLVGRRHCAEHREFVRQVLLGVR